MSAVIAKPIACMPIRLISCGNSHRASYSRKPVGFTKGRRSKSAVLGLRSVRGAGRACAGRLWAVMVSPALIRPCITRVPRGAKHGSEELNNPRFVAGHRSCLYIFGETHELIHPQF